MFSIDWQQKFMDLVVYAGNWQPPVFALGSTSRPFAATNPYQFLYYVFMFLTPMFVLSGYLAYRLAKDIDRNEKTKRAKTHQQANIAKVRRHAKRD